MAKIIRGRDWGKANTVFQKKLLSAVKHEGGSFMGWGCLAASGPEQLATINNTRKEMENSEI